MVVLAPEDNGVDKGVSQMTAVSEIREIEIEHVGIIS